MRVRGERFRGGGGRRLAAIALAAAAIACGPKLPVTTRPDADAARALFVGPPDSWIRVSVATGDGRIVEEIQGEPPAVGGYGPYVEGRIADPVLSPDGGRIAMVRWVEWGDRDRLGSLGSLSGEIRLVVRDRSTGEERTLLDPSDHLPSSLTWSKDGTKLAAVQAADILVFDVADGALVGRTTLTSTPGSHVSETFVVWDWQSDRIALHRWCMDSPCHAWIDPVTGSVDPVPAKSLDSPYSFKYLSTDVSIGLDRAELERMFRLFYGSVENPREHEQLSWSPDRRFYVYFQSASSTFFLRTWYEGYDTRTGTIFLVKDCGKHFEMPLP